MLRNVSEEIPLAERQTFLSKNSKSCPNPPEAAAGAGKSGDGSFIPKRRSVKQMA